jgi:hypothetical protein
MDLPTTIALMAAAAVLVGLSLWGTRRKRGFAEVSYVPWHGLLFVGILGFCVLAAHLVTLLTGVPLKGGRR